MVAPSAGGDRESEELPVRAISTKGSIYAPDPTADHTGGDSHGAPQIQSVRDN